VSLFYPKSFTALPPAGLPSLQVNHNNPSY